MHIKSNASTLSDLHKKKNLLSKYYDLGLKFQSKPLNRIGRRKAVNKKYQVFVSSTYKDLKEERLAVTQFLLKMGFIPVGMEQFPASNMSQMEYIKMMLDSCDYYLLILAGKYGTIDVDGVGFTEKEYDYAIANNIPVMSILIKDIGKLASEKCEETDTGRALLKSFRDKVSAGKMVDFYTDIGSLTSAVGAAVYLCVQSFPAKGWIRGDSTDGAEDIEAKIEEYLHKHTTTKEDIEALFANATIILDGGNASSHTEKKTTESPCDTISMAGARTLVEELAKKLPEVEWGEF